MLPHRLMAAVSVLTQSWFRFWLVFLFTFLLLFANLHRGDLAGYDDAVYAHEGKQMLLTSDWWNVWLNGKLDFDKPPLFIWLEALSFWLLGVSDFAAKFPSALLGLATVVLVYFLALELSNDEWLASLAMFVLASTQYFLKYATHAMTDVPFTFLFTLAIWAYLKALRRPAFFLLCGSAIGLAGLTRSILGLLALGVIGAHLLVSRKWTCLRSRYLWLGLGIALSLPLGWFFTQYHWYGAQFVQHHFSFTAENARSIDPLRGWRFVIGLGEYPFLLLKLFWPWLPCLIGGLILAMRGLRNKSSDDRAGLTTDALWLLLLWVVVVICPFSLIAHKVLRYILPAFPALAILCALALWRWLPVRHRAAGFAAACVVLGISVLFISLSASHRLRAVEIRPLAGLAEAATPSARPILLYTSGAARWDYLHQIIWYTDRRGLLLTDVAQTLCYLEHPVGATAIVDRVTYEQYLLPVVSDLEVLGQSETLVCVRRDISPQRLATSAKMNLQTTSVECD